MWEMGERWLKVTIKERRDVETNVGGVEALSA
jgi:hypothetical protein